MIPRDQGFLLLTSHLGDPERHPLTVAQFRELTRRARQMEAPKETRNLEEKDLLQLGCDHDFTKRVLHLLSQEEQLEWYLEAGRKKNCFPLLRLQEQYPASLRTKLGLDAPACLWYKGNLQILQKPAVSLVGSRDLLEENKAFARETGKQAALQGYVLISGNARGADQTAQESCLAYGGAVISIVADELWNKPQDERVLYLSEDGFDQPFSSIRALSRNRLIHAMGEKTFVVQCTFQKGGTWSGTTQNLRNNWSSVFCFDDGSESMAELEQRGAKRIGKDDLSSIGDLQTDIFKIF